MGELERPGDDGHLSVESLDVIARLLYTPRKAAVALGIGRSKLYELLRSGELESIHIGASRRVPARALDEFI